MTRLVHTALAHVRLQQHGGFVGCRGALERHSADQHDKMSLAQLGARPIERLRPGERVEVVPGLGEARDRFRSELGAERDHDVIRKDILAADVDASGQRVDLVDLAPHQFDAGLGKGRDRA